MFSAPRSLVPTKRASFKFSVASLFATAAWLGISPLASAQNTIQTYSGSATGDLSLNTNYTPNGVPTVTTDVLISGSTAYTGLTLSAASVTFGSLNDTDTAAVTLLNTGGRVLTLGGAGDLGNKISGTATDLLYVASGGTLSIGVTGITLSTEGTNTGTFDIAGTATITSPISGAAFGVGFNKTGAGTLTLSGANTFNGPIGVNAGTLTAGVASNSGVNGAFGVNTTITLANATGVTLNIGNFNTQIGSLTGGGANGGNVTLGTGTLTLGADNTSPAAYAGVISGGGGLTKIGIGTETLTGTNTYTGTTTVNGGTLSLDFTNNTGSIIATGHALAFGGGALNLIANANGSSETFSGTTFNAGGSSVLFNGVNGGSSTLALGALTRNAGGTVDFASTGGTVTTTSTTFLNNGVLASTANGTAFATVGGTTWATLSGSNIVGLANASYTEASTAGSTAASYNAANIDVDSSQAPTGVITPNTLRFNTAGAETLTLATGTNIIGAGGILVTTNAGANAQTITGGTLEGSNTGKDLVLIQNDTATGAGLTIASTIADNTTATTLTKSGPGLVTLSNTLNTYTGGTFLNGGILNIAADTSLGSATATLTMNGGTLQLASAFNLATTRGITLGNLGGTFDTQSFTSSYSGVITGVGGFTKTGTGTLTLNTANTFTGGLTVAQGTLIAPLNTVIGSGTAAVTPIVLGTPNSGNSASFLLGSTSTAQTVNNPITLATGASGTLTAGNVPTTTTATTFNGPVLLNGGTITLVNSATTFSTAVSFNGGATGTGSVVIDNNNNVTGSAATITLATGLFNNVGTLTNSGTGTGALFINTGGFGPNLVGFVQNSLTSPTTINVNNASFTGTTTIAAGVAAFAGSSGGNPTAFGSGTIILGGGTGTTASAYLDTFNPSGTVANNLTIASGSTNNVLALGTGSAFTVAGNITLANNLSLVSGAQSLTVTGAINGTGNLLIDAGIGTLTLANVVSTGTITDAGYGSSVALIGGSLNANVSSVTVAGSPGTRLSLSGNDSSFAGSVNLKSGILDLDTVNALPGGGTVLGALTITGGTLTAGLQTNSINALVLSTANPENWNGNFAFGATTVSGTGNSLSTGAGGTITLGANVQVSNVTSGTLTVGTAAATAANLTGSGNLTLSEQYTGGYGFTGTVNNVGSITTTGAGTGAITFTGAIGSGVTSFTQGTNGVTTFSVPEAYTGSTTINGGTLALTFSTANTANIIPVTSALTLGGGNLRLNTVAGSTGQTFASTTVNAGPSTDTFGTAPTAFALNLGAITRNAGGTVVFNQPNTSTQTAANGIITSTANTNGILGGWATVGNEFATNNIDAGGGNIVAQSSYTALPASGTLGTVNYKVGGSGSGFGGVTVTTAGDSPVNSLNLQTDMAAGDTINNGGTITVSSGGILASESLASTSTTHSILGGALTSSNAQNDLIATVNNASTSGVTNLTISSTIQDTTAGMSLTKSGNGTLTLTGTNTYTGATYFNGGIVNVNADTALGTAPGAVTANELNLAGGTLQLGASIAAINPNRGITVSGTGGTIDTNTFSTSYAGVITGTGSFTKVGAGTLSLTGANTYTGSTNIVGGVLNVTNDGNLGAVPAGLQQNAITISGGTLQFNASFGVNANRGILVGAGGATFDTGANTVYLPGQLVGTGANVANITKVGSGLLLLSPTTGTNGTTGAPNSYSFNGGEMFAPTASTSTATTYSASAPEAYNFNGGTQLFLTTSTNFGTGGGNIYLNTGGGTLDVALALSPFNYPGGAATPVSGIISGPGSLSKVGAGTITFNNLNTYTGATNLSGSTVNLTFKNTANSGVFYNGVTAANAGALTLGGVTLASTGANNTANVQNFGSTTFAAGGDTFTIVGGTGTASVLFNLGSLARNAGGVVSFTQPTVDTTISSTNGYVTSTTNTNGILGGYATVGNDFATNSTNAAGGNIIALPSASYATTLAGTGADATANYKMTTGTTTVGNDTVNSLNLQVGTLAQTAGTTLKVASGGILGTASLPINGGTLSSTNTQNDLIFTVTGGTGTVLTVSSAIADTTTGMALTKGGVGTLKLTGTNAYTGATYLDGGILNIATEGATTGSAGSLGTVPSAVTPGALTFNGGTLQLAAALNLNSNRGITFLSNGGTIDTNSFNAAYGGVITGNGPLYKAGLGTLTLTGANPAFTGQTFIAGGILNVSAESTLGTLVASTGVGSLGGDLVIAGGTLQFGASFNLNPARTISIPYAVSGSTIDTNGYNTTYGGSIVSNNSTLYKAGAGTLTLTGTVGMNGQLFVNGGGVLFNGLYSGNQPIVVNPGAMIGGIGTVTTAAPINVVSSGNTPATIATISAGSGNTVGLLTLTSAAVTLSPSSVYNAVVNSNGTAGINYSELLNPGGITVSTGATFTITTTPGATFTPGSILTLISNDVTAGGTTNTFANTIATAGGFTFTADYTDNPGSFDVVVSVPEPSTWISGVLMLGTLGYHQRRRLGRLVGRI